MSKTTTLNFEKTMTISELRTFIPAVAEDITVMVKSEPGCGKTSLLGMIAEDIGDEWRNPRDTKHYPDDKYDYIYVDCPVKDMQDIGMTIPNHTTQSLEYYVSSLFKLRGESAKRPKVILLDEVMKAPKLLQIIFTRLMLERMVGDEPLPDGSMIFATSNNESDGVGDNMLAHLGNRVCIVRMQKPTAMEWLTNFANPRGISRPVRAFVAMYPKCMASYLDKDQEDNPYIFKPNGPKSFCSPRSLAKSDAIVKKRDVLTDNALHAGLAGTIGAAAAGDMAAFLAVEKSLVPTDKIVKDPDGTPVPKEIAAQLMVLFQAVDVLETHDDLNKFMIFVNKIPSQEIQSIFFTMCMRSPRMVKLAARNEHIKKWALDNHMMF